MALFNDEITLVSIEYIQDEIGQDIEKRTEKVVYCAIKSISTNEFYKAAQNALRPSVTFIIHEFEYEGERKVIFKGEEYSVTRTYVQGRELELTCEKVGENV